MITTYHIEKFWDDEYKHLTYINEPYNDEECIARWLALGYQPKLAGHLCDMRQQQPSWNDRFIKFLQILLQCFL